MHFALFVLQTGLSVQGQRKDTAATDVGVQGRANERSTNGGAHARGFQLLQAFSAAVRGALPIRARTGVRPRHHHGVQRRRTALPAQGLLHANALCFAAVLLR